MRPVKHVEQNTPIRRLASKTYDDVRIRVEVVVILSSGDLRDIDVHTAVVAPIVRAGHKDEQGMARSNM